MEELRIMREEMAAMTEAGRDPAASDVSEAEQEGEPETEDEIEDIAVKLLKAVIGASSEPRLEMATYNGGLNPE